MNRPFLVLALPRSRTAWLAELLDRGHDTLVEARDAREWADGLGGAVETLGGLAWRFARDRRPGLRLVTVRRPLAEVRASLERLGLDGGLPGLAGLDAGLDAAEAAGAKRFEWKDLGLYRRAGELYQYCTGYPLDYEYWLNLNRRNIQRDPMAMLARCRERAPELRYVMDELCGAWAIRA